ncbi:MAG: flavodoxin family protein [Thermoguttaceae bacterium]|jgi:NAD(P)H dehydrogenase (quinone)
MSRLGSLFPSPHVRKADMPRLLIFLALACPAAAVWAAEKSPPEGPAGAVRVLVAYYSLTGNTEQMARGVAEGIGRVPGVTAVVKPVADVTKADLEAADGIVLGCPTYFSNIPGRMKVIIDDWSWKMKVDFTDKVGGAFATGGGEAGGKEHVVNSLLLFMLSNRMVVAGPLYRNEKTGSLWGEPGATAVTGPLDPGISRQKLDAAARLGQRVAGLAKRLKKPEN